MKDKNFTRREVLKAGALTAGGVAFGGFTPHLSFPATKSITVNCYGGAYEKALRDNFVKCFQAKTGIPVNVMVGIPSAALSKIRASEGNPDVDVFIATASTTIEAINQNLVEKLNFSKIPNIKDLPKVNWEQWDNYGVSFSYGVGGIMYNKDKIKNPPKTWAEFVDRTIKGDFGKYVTIPSINFAEGPSLSIWTIAQAFGGSVANAGIAFEKVAAMKANIPKFYSDASEVVNMMATGEIQIATYIDGRAWAFYDKGNPWVGWVTPEKGGVFLSSQAMKVKNSAPESFEFINCLLDPLAQTSFAKAIQYPVTNPKVKYPPELVDRMGTQKDLIYPPQREIMKVVPAWVERWNKEIGG
jgi:putative spermidine/putrescine transport system substrate-binding protein